MDLEIQMGFDDLQSKIYESRLKLKNLEALQKIAVTEGRVNDLVIQDFFKGDIETQFIFQPVGRMLVKRVGQDARDFLIEKRKQYQGKIESYNNAKKSCFDSVKEAEDELRDLVNWKLHGNAQRQQQPPQQEKKPQDKQQQPVDDAQKADNSVAAKSEAALKQSEVPEKSDNVVAESSKGTQN